MSTTTTHLKCLAAVLGTAMASAAIVVSAAPAHAAGCQQWEFDGTFSWISDRDDVISSVAAQGTHIDGRYSVGGNHDYGQMLGDITGDTVNLQIGNQGPSGLTYRWTGQIDPEGNVTGPVPGDPGHTWQSMTPPLVCKATPPEITLRFDPPTPVGITAWAGITNNAGKPPVICTFSDGVLPPRLFSVDGDVQTPIPLPGIPTGHVYNVTVQCGDLTYTQKKQF